jgi:hypothetical protein
MLFYFFLFMLQPLWDPLHYICLILLGLMSNICLAQELPLELASLDASQKSAKTHTEPSQPRAIDRVTERPKVDSGLDLRITLDSSYQSSNYWNEYARQPSYHINYEYGGIQGVIYTQLEKLANRYYKQQLATFWDQSYSRTSDLDRQMRLYQLEASDSGYHWWDRTWRESLPPEKGGQITATYQIGSKIDVMRIGPLGLTNEGRFSWESWRLDVEDNPGVNRGAQADVEALRKGALQEKYNLGLKSPEAEYGDEWFQFRMGVRLNIRADNLAMGNKSEVGLNFKLILLNHGRAYVKLTGSAKYQPLTGQAEAQLQLSLLEF